MARMNPSTATTIFTVLIVGEDETFVNPESDAKVEQRPNTRRRLPNKRNSAFSCSLLITSSAGACIVSENIDWLNVVVLIS